MTGDWVHRQRHPLVESVCGGLVRAHQVERGEDHVGLRGQDAVGIIVEPQPAVLRVLCAMPQEVPGPQVPLGRQPLGRNLHLHGRFRSGGRLGMGRQVPAAHSRDGALPCLFFMGAGLLADGAQFPGLEFLDELRGTGGLRGQEQRRLRGGRVTISA